MRRGTPRTHPQSTVYREVSALSLAQVFPDLEGKVNKASTGQGPAE